MTRQWLVIVVVTGALALPTAGLAAGPAGKASQNQRKAGDSAPTAPAQTGTAPAQNAPAAPASGAANPQAQKAVGKRVLKFDALKIEGEHETPDVIIIQEWSPPRDEVIQDQASDDLDRVFTGIRSLNRGFDRELSATPDAGAISAESKARSEEQRLYQREKPQKAERNRKTSLR